MKDDFNTGGCNGCKWHGKDSEDTCWTYDDGTPRNDTCSRPRSRRPRGYALGEPIPVFNTGCKYYTPEASA